MTNALTKGIIVLKSVTFGLYHCQLLVVFINRSNGNGLQCVVMVERVRHLWNKTTRDVHFYLSSLPADAQHLGRVIRQHWGIENQVHWKIDVTFKEDQCRIRFGHSPRNFAFLRRLALNLLNQEKTFKSSVRQKSKRASMKMSAICGGDICVGMYGVKQTNGFQSPSRMRDRSRPTMERWIYILSSV